MQIEVDKLGRTSKPFSKTYEASEIFLDDESAALTAAVCIQGQVERTDLKVRVVGSLTSEAQLDCDRCLKRVSFPIEMGFDVTYVPEVFYESKVGDPVEGEDVNLSVYSGDTIDLDELVQEQILLALPTHVLCSEECKGLCVECGTNLNLGLCSCEPVEADPRWGVLKKLNTAN